MSVLNRPLFQRYARQPMMQQPMQQPMMQQPTGVMASSPELMQASMGYKQGGMVQGYQNGMIVNANSYSDPFLNPPAQEPAVQAPVAQAPAVQAPVDITQSPTSFLDSILSPTTGAFGGTGSFEPSTGPIMDSVFNLTTYIAKQMSGDDPLTGAENIGTAVENGTVEPEAVGLTKEELDQSPSEQASAALKAAGKNVPKGTKGKIEAMKSLISDAFGVDASRYDNLRSLNRAAIGFAIAEGGDIATALKQGAQGAAAIEEKQLSREDSMSKIALEQVFAEKMAAMKASAAGGAAGANKFRNPINAYQDALESAMEQGKDPGFKAQFLEPNGLSLTEYAQQQAMAVVQSSYTPGQLAGTPFASASEPAGKAVNITAPTATGGGLPVVTNQTEYDALPPGAEFIQNGETRSKPKE